MVELRYLILSYKKPPIFMFVLDINRNKSQIDKIGGVSNYF